MNFLSLVFAAAFSLQTYALGGVVGNGGVTLTCAKSSENSFEGDYFVDYVVQFNPAQRPVAVSSLDMSLDRIDRILAKVPWMISSFRIFRADFMIERDYSRRNIWESAQFGLEDLTLVALPPENCRTYNQAVIRVSPSVSGLPPEKRVFRYVPRLIERLRATGPLQMSFLLVHEWLWSLELTEDQNSRLNYILHTSQLEEMSAEAIAALLKSLGVKKPDFLDPWDSASCTHDPDYLMKLNAYRKGKPLSSLDLGYGEPVIVHRLNSVDDSIEYRKYFAPHVYFGLEGENTLTSFYVYSQKPNYPIENTLLKGNTFYSDGKPLDPSGFFSPTGSGWELFDPIEVSVGSTCVRVYGRDSTEEFVLLFSK